MRQFLLQGHEGAMDKAIAILPLFHAYGMSGVMNLGVHLAATLVLLPLFDVTMLMEAAVVGVPSRVRGERVKAFVVLKEGVTAKAPEIIAFCKEQLAPYKVPRSVVFCDELPKSLAGKVLRRVLREEELARMTESKK